MPAGVYPRSEAQKEALAAQLPHHKLDPLVRFWRMIRMQPNGCWVWKGSLNNKGYARINIDRHAVYAHRFSFESFRGPIPFGKELDHGCRNTTCVNPWHLEPVTHPENVRRGAEARWTGYCKHGHALTTENIYQRKSGRHECRICHRNAERRRYGQGQKMRLSVS